MPFSDFAWSRSSEICDPEHRAELNARVTWGMILRKLGIPFMPNSTGQIFIRCLFHAEKTPSMHFYHPDNATFSCHGCHIGGDKVEFVFRYLHGGDWLPDATPTSRADLDAFFEACAQEGEDDPHARPVAPP